MPDDPIRKPFESAEEQDARLTAEALAELDAGIAIPSEEIDAWIDSLETENELPPPKARKIS